MLKDDIQNDIYIALKEKKERDLKVLRYILSLIKYAEIDKQKDLTDDEVVLLLQKEIKKRQEAIELFKKGKRNDLVEDEGKQIEIIKRYLPQQLSDEEINKIIEKVILLGESNVGKIIGLVMVQVRGRADGKRVSELVNKRLDSKN